MARPMEGFRVLDFSHALAGPYCSMLLGDLGADVIKVEPHGRGDDTRHWGPPFIGAESAYFLSVNRNKRSICLDLKSEEGIRAARALARKSDVVVENFRPGTTARLGIGYEQMRSENGSLIYCSISGFGQHEGALAGYDQIIQGTAGLMSITGEANGPPTKVGIPIADLSAGMFAANGILAALLARVKTGEGCYLDIALQDCIIALLSFQAGRYLAAGHVPSREGNHHPTIAPYGMFETADGYINIAVGNDAQWARLCSVLEAPHLLEDESLATNRSRLQFRPRLHEALEPILRARTTGAWLEVLENGGVPAGPIRSLDEVFADPLVMARNMKLEVEHPTVGTLSVTGAPWSFGEGPLDARLPPPLLGEHSLEVLEEVAGYTRDAALAATETDVAGVD